MASLYNFLFLRGWMRKRVFEHDQPCKKDVDGFHPINIGRLAQKGREPLFVPGYPRRCDGPFGEDWDQN